MLRVSCYAPLWWTEAHPGECQLDGWGGDFFELQRAGRIRLPSLASEQWKSDLCLSLAKYIAWLIESGWSRKVAALFLSGGITWEWSILGSDKFPDTSRPAVEFFRDFLRKKYTTNTALSDAWGTRTSFEEAGIPSVEERSASHGLLRSPPTRQNVIDHQLSLGAMNAELILEVFRTARNLTGIGGPLLGAFYGYTLTARDQTSFTGQYGAGGFVGGHHGLARVLESPDIDFLGSPFNYADRELGTGLLFEHAPLASIHAHGKAFFDENDLWIKPPVGDDRAASISVGIAENLEEALMYLQAAWAQALVRGKHLWFTELTGWLGELQEMFDQPEILDEISRLNQLSKALCRLDRSPVAEVAYVIDEESVAHLPLDSIRFRDHVYMGSVQWGHLGAPFDLVLLSDVLSGKCRNYKLLVGAHIASPSSVGAFEEWRNAHPQVAVYWRNEPGWMPADRSDILSAYKLAGVHCHTAPGPVVWANASMIMVQAASDGQVELRLPSRGLWTEVLSKLKLQHHTSSEIHLHMHKGETKLFAVKQ